MLINQLLWPPWVEAYAFSRRPNWACLHGSVCVSPPGAVCKPGNTLNVKYLRQEDAWAPPICGWLWGLPAAFWPIGVQIKFLAYLIRDRAVLPMNDAWPSKRVFCHCHLQEAGRVLLGAWRRPRAGGDHMHKQAIQKRGGRVHTGSRQVHRNAHWPKTEQEARGD